MQNRNKRDRKRLKEEKEKDGRKYKGQCIYAGLEIIKVPNVFQYLLRI